MTCDPTEPMLTFLRSKVTARKLMLFVVACLIFLGNSLASPYFLDPWNLSDATFNFTEKAMIAFAMALVIIAGEIDLSVASVIALASTAMGYAVQLGFDTPALVALRATLASPGLLVLADTWYPGWSVRVDGRPAPLLRADHAFRAVALPAGEHRVEFHYQPTWLVPGVALGLLGAGGLLAAMLIGRGPKRPAEGA